MLNTTKGDNNITSMKPVNTNQKTAISLLNDKEQETMKNKRKIVYKNSKINELTKEVNLYSGNINEYDPGDIIRLKNNAIAQVILKNNRKMILFISPNNLIDFAKLLSHQRFANKDWPERNDPLFKSKINNIFAELGLLPEVNKDFDPNACDKSKVINRLNYYQKIVTAYLVYSKIRGLLVWHSMGSGKTCTSIDVMNQVIKRNQLIKKMKLGNKTDREFKIFVVLPPAKALEEGFRAELARCPSVIRKQIKKSLKREDLKIDLTNNIINKYVTIISYVSLANKVIKNEVNLENSLLIMDEVHKFLTPFKQFEKKYRILENVIRSTSNIKLLLLTGTPIYRDFTDLTKIINLLKHVSEKSLPTTNDTFVKQYFNNRILNKRKLIEELQGYISYYNAENDLNYFPKFLDTDRKITQVTDDHYIRWQNSFKNELYQYNIDSRDVGELFDFTEVTHPKFIEPNTGLLKKSSAQSNYPARSYKSKGIWPKKFKALLDSLESNPNDKHFVWSRHKESGTNAIGYFLEKNGWTRMSRNVNDHGSNPPKNYSKLGEELFNLNLEFKQKKITQQQYMSAKANLLETLQPKKPYYGFTVLNNTSSKISVKRCRDLFNDPDNIDGKYVRVFIVDESFSEGISLMGVKHGHLFDQPTSQFQENQIKARARRYCSHKNLPVDERYVKQYEYFAKGPKDEKLTDSKLNEYKAKNYEILKQVNDVSIEASIEYDLEDIAIDMQTKNKLTTLLKLKNILEPDSEKHLPMSKFKIPIPSVRPASDFKKDINIKPSVIAESKAVTENVENKSEINKSNVQAPVNKKNPNPLKYDSDEEYKKNALKIAEMNKFSYE